MIGIYNCHLFTSICVAYAAIFMEPCMYVHVAFVL